MNEPSGEADDYLFGLALAYLDARPVEQPEYARLLIRKQARSIRPIVRAVLRQLTQHAQAQPELINLRSGETQANRFREATFLSLIVDGTVASALRLMGYIGSPASSVLVDLVGDPDPGVARTAALILASQHLADHDALRSPDVVERLTATLDSSNEDGVVGMLVAVCLARWGSWKAQERLAIAAARAGVAAEDVMENARSEGARSLLETRD